MNNPLKINYMKLSDIDDISKVEAEAYGDHHWSRDSFVNELSNNLARYYVARSMDGEILGYLGAWIILDEAHITTIAVSKKFRRQNVAQILLINFINDCYANKVKYITLEVRISNEPAINLYTKYGFNSLGTRKNYYQDNNEDALIMWTENIWYDKFKVLYNQNIENLKNIEVYFEKN